MDPVVGRMEVLVEHVYSLHSPCDTLVLLPSWATLRHVPRPSGHLVETGCARSQRPGVSILMHVCLPSSSIVQ